MNKNGFLCLFLGFLFIFSKQPLFSNETSTSQYLVQDILAESPPFLTPAEVLDDITTLEKILQEVYGRYTILQNQGHDWDSLWFDLKSRLTETNKSILTQNLLTGILNTLEFTKDPTFRAELTLHHRLYGRQLEKSYYPAFTSIRLVQEQTRYRVLPSNQLSVITNQWLVNCNPPSIEFFPLIPERGEEKRFALGLFSSNPPQTLVCHFQDGGGKTHRENLAVQYFKNSAFSDDEETPLFSWTPGNIPYVRWMRDGKHNASDTQRFFRLLTKLRQHTAFIIDVRGNTTGSFGFIENWLSRLTKSSWQNGIVQEKQTPAILYGILNRMELEKQSPGITFEKRQEIQKEQERLISLIRYIEKRKPPFRLNESRFSFSGDASESKWQKRMVVVADRQCGNGCQFLAALAKQLKNSFLLGENTGVYPQGIKLPLFQLPNSKIRITINHLLHLDHFENPVPPSGYQPDFWLDHPAPLSEIYRLARSRLSK